MTETPTWQADRDNWSTTVSATFRTRNPEKFGPAEWARGQLTVVGPDEETGWLTVPERALSPDCEPVDGRCACGRSAV